MILLLKASLVIIFLLSFYKLFLEKESFFKANRIYLLSCLVLACALPFVMLPKMINHQGYVDNLIEPLIVAPSSNDTSDLLIEPIDKSEDQTNSENSEESESMNDQMIINGSNPDLASTKVDKLEIFEPIESQEGIISKGWSFWLLCIYFFGVAVLLVNLLGQVFNVVLKVVKSNDKIEDEGIVIVNTDGETEPCSFFKYIFINPSSYDFDTYEQIIAHEKVHVKKRHTIDLLISEIAVIILWFNPFVWLLRKEVEKNIEYQTDQTLINDESQIKETYQLNLVKIACNTSPLAITTNYNQSLIKQRIMRMNAKRSNQFNYWKYAFCMPLVFVLLLILNRPLEGISQAINLPIDDGVEEMMDVANEMIEEPINEIEKEKKITPSAKTPKQKPVQAKQTQPANQTKVLDNKLIADCEEFEKAVAKGDLELVKKILKTIDPDCLKANKKNGNNPKSVVKIIKEKRKELQMKSDNITDKDHAACEKLRIARDESNEILAKQILMTEDINCMHDSYGNPSQDIDLIKYVLNYGARLSIDYGGLIHISTIGFYIDTKDPDAKYCKDPNYKKLVVAIRNRDKSGVREIISGDLLTCPLNEDGKTNDFIFMKKIMKFRPEINFHSSSAITVNGVGFIINLDGVIEKPNTGSYDDNDDSDIYYYESDDHEEIQSRLNEVSDNPENASCLHLIDAITIGDNSLVNIFLKSMDTDCFHRETTSLSKDGKESLIASKVTTPLTAAIRNRSLNLVKIILDKGADLNYTGYGKETPLIVAVKTGNDEIVKYLVDKGADINRKDQAKMSALDCAKYYDFDSIAKYLESKGAR